MANQRWRRPLCGAMAAAAVARAGAQAERPSGVCVWDHFKDATFDLRALMKTDRAYHILDGDDPCTRIEEDPYDYYFNLCADIVGPEIPGECASIADTRGGKGAAVQYDPRAKTCRLIGEYQADRDETMWALLDDADPSKGVRLRYEGNRQSLCSNGVMRTFTIDVMCSNHLQPTVLSTLEPEHCQYHATIKSVHGCPKECVTTAGGLCDGHGHCAYDPGAKAPHCYCNDGRGGADCSLLLGAASPSGHYRMQIGLLVTLLLFVMALVGAVGYMVMQVYTFRKDAAGRYTAFNGSELGRRDGF